MGAFTTTYERIIRQPALTMPGNFTGSEAACTAGNASSIRTLLSLATTSDVTFDIIRATTSVQTPLVNNASAALTLGNSTYGVTVPGVLRVGTTNGTIQLTNGSGTSQQVLQMFGSDLYLDNPNAAGSMNFRVGTGLAQGLVLASTGAATFSGSTYHGGTSRVAIEPYSTTYSRVAFNSYLSGGDWTTGTTGYSAQLLFESGSGGLQIQTTAGSNTGGVAHIFLPRLTFGHGTPSPITISSLAYLAFEGTNTPYIQQSGGYLYTGAGGSARTRVGTDGLVVTGDISMSKTSAQGYIRAWSDNGVCNISIRGVASNQGYIETNIGSIISIPYSGLFGVTAGDGASTPKIRAYSTATTKWIENYHDGTNGIVSTSSGDLRHSAATGAVVCYTPSVASVMYVYAGNGSSCATVQHNGTLGIMAVSHGIMRLQTDQATYGFEFRPKSGYIEHYTPGANANYTIWDSTGSKYLGATYDGTNGILSTSSGNLNLVPTGGTVAVTGGITASGRVDIDTSTDYQLQSKRSGTVAFYLGHDTYRDFFVYDNASLPAFKVNTTTESANKHVTMYGGLTTAYVAKTANYTTTAADHLVNVTANSIDITLETAVGCAGRIHEIINTGSGTVTMKTTSAQTISGSASGALTLAQWKSMTVKSDGANWLIISQIT
jgi:hypothetical protein